MVFIFYLSLTLPVWHCFFYYSCVFFLYLSIFGFYLPQFCIVFYYCQSYTCSVVYYNKI
jgi:hypothetical protein